MGFIVKTKIVKLEIHGGGAADQRQYGMISHQPKIKPRSALCNTPTVGRNFDRNFDIKAFT